MENDGWKSTRNLTKPVKRSRKQSAKEKKTGHCRLKINKGGEQMARTLSHVIHCNDCQDHVSESDYSTYLRGDELLFVTKEDKRHDLKPMNRYVRCCICNTIYGLDVPSHKNLSVIIYQGDVYCQRQGCVTVFSKLIPKIPDENPENVITTSKDCYICSGANKTIKDNDDDPRLLCCSYCFRWFCSHCEFRPDKCTEKGHDCYGCSECATNRVVYFYSNEHVFCSQEFEKDAYQQFLKTFHLDTVKLPYPA